MKIRFLLTNVYSQGGGIITVTFDLAGELAKRHDVELVSLFGRRRPGVHQPPPGVEIHNLIPADEAAESPSRRRLRQELSGLPTQLVASSDPRYGLYSQYTDRVIRDYVRSIRQGVLVTMQPGITMAAGTVPNDRPVRVAQDHRPYRGRSQRHLDAYRRAAENLDEFLTLTQTDARRYRRLMGDLVPVRAMPNGTPPYLGPLSTQGTKTVVAAGRLEPSKGFDLLVEAWRQVAAAHPDWRLRIFGEGSKRDVLQQQIDEYGLTDSIHLEGFSTDLQVQMSRADLFVLSSRAEGYPRVILEAMAVGLPVVSTACPTGPREMVATGVDGILVPNKDSDALGAGINALIERGPDGRRAMGEAALARVASRSQARIADRWEKHFERLAREKQRLPLPRLLRR